MDSYVDHSHHQFGAVWTNYAPPLHIKYSFKCGYQLHTTDWIWGWTKKWIPQLNTLPPAPARKDHSYTQYPSPITTILSNIGRISLPLHLQLFPLDTVDLDLSIATKDARRFFQYCEQVFWELNIGVYQSELRVYAICVHRGWSFTWCVRPRSGIGWADQKCRLVGCSD